MFLAELRRSAGFCLIAFLIIVAFVAIGSYYTFESPMFRFQDFIEYWGAYRLRSDNPYDPTALLEIQNAEGAERVTPLMMWNPPWTLLLIPGIWLPFQNAAFVWTLCNIAFWGGSALLMARVFSSDVRTGEKMGLSWIVPALISFPSLVNLQMGQMGGLLTLGTALCFFGWYCRRQIFFGLGGALMTVKPHLFAILAVYFLVRIIKERRWDYLASAGICIALLVGWSTALYPDATLDWLAAMKSPPAGAIDPRRWFTPTIGKWIDVLLARSNIPAGRIGSLTLFVSGVIFAARLAQKGASERQQDGSMALFALIISICLSPFGWIFDQSVLVLPQTVVIAKVLESSDSFRIRWTVLSAFILVQFALLVHWIGFGMEMQAYAWFPIVQSLLIVILYRQFLSQPSPKKMSGL